MCLKTKKDLSNEIIKEAEDIKELKEKLLVFTLVKLNVRYNITDIRARLLVDIPKEEYNYIAENYAQLIAKYPDVKEKTNIRFEYIKSANRAKRIATKGCDNCINKIMKKLDVKIEDLCENCQYLIRKYQSIMYENNI